MKIEVAIQGVEGSYSEEAARRFFGAKANIVECLNFEDTFNSVISNQTKYAVVPLKNKIVGEITSATEFLNRTNLKISGRTAARSPACSRRNKDGEIGKYKNRSFAYRSVETMPQVSFRQ